MLRTPPPVRRSERIAQRRGNVMTDTGAPLINIDEVTGDRAMPPGENAHSSAPLPHENEANMDDRAAMFSAIVALTNKVEQLTTAISVIEARTAQSNTVENGRLNISNMATGGQSGHETLTNQSSSPLRLVPTNAQPNASVTSGSNAWTLPHVTMPQINSGNTPARSTPVYNQGSAASIHATNNVAAGFVRHLHDLPEFSGRPEEWPMFSAAYEHSNAAYGYSNYENSQRLHKCLKGEARDAVSSLLIYPDNVDAVIEHLRFRFGRSEQLVGSQLNIVKAVAPITENGIEKVVPFANKVRYLAIFLQNLNSQHHIANPTLLEELVSKLPMGKRMEWAKVAMQSQPYPTLIEFSNWLTDLANLVCIMQGSKCHNTTEAKRRVVLHADDGGSKQRETCAVCDGTHKVVECKQFGAQIVRQRWELAKQHKLCFACLRQGHTTRSCSWKGCPVSGCGKKHHKMLHAQNEIDIKKQPQNCEVKDQPAVLSCRKNTMSKNTRLLFRILPVTLFGPSARIDTFALFDEGSFISMVDSSLLDELGIKGKDRSINVKWFGGKSAKQKAIVVQLQIGGKGMSEKYVMHDVYGVKNIELPSQTLQLDDLPVSLEDKSLPSYNCAKPLVLIGLDHCHLGAARETYEIMAGGPYVANTKLGWVVYGTTVGAPTEASCLAVYCAEEDLHDKVLQYFDDENFGVKVVPLLESEDD